MTHAPHIDVFERMLARARQGASPCYHTLRLPVESADALALYRAAALKRPSQALFFWHAPEQWLMGLGHAHQVRVPQGASRFEVMSDTLGEACSSEDALWVGGFAFDETRGENAWRGYDALHFWVPSQLICLRDGHLEARLTFCCTPADDIDTLTARAGGPCRPHHERRGDGEGRARSPH